MSANKKVLDDILGELKSLRKLQEKYSVKVDLIVEVINHMHSKIADISCKIDLNSSSLNIQSSAKTTKKTKSSAEAGGNKPKLNIMSYFKLKYKEDRESLNEIISEKETEDLFLKFENELKTKKKSGLETAKLALVYKELFRKNEQKIKMLRGMKEAEEELEAEKHQQEILECEIQEEQECDAVSDYEEEEEEEEDDDA